MNIKGAGASPGVAIGPAFVIYETEVEVPIFDDPGQAFSEAAAAVAESLRASSKIAGEAGRKEAENILNAQAMMAEDAMLSEAVTAHLESGSRLGEAVNKAGKEVADMLASLDDPYLAARSADVGEIAERIRRQLAGASQVRIANTVPSIIVANMITAADTAVMNPDSILGLLTETGGPTGHVAVIARSLGIPAVVGAVEATSAARLAKTVALDGTTGEVAFDPGEDEHDAFVLRRVAYREMMKAASAFRGKHVEVNGQRIRVAANVGTPDDLTAAMEARSDGIGLFRTEFLYLGRSKPPSQEE